MKIGYFYWGYLGDKISNKINSPDGNAWYSSSIISECKDRNYDIYLFGENRDTEDFIENGESIFSSFMFNKRLNAFMTPRIPWKNKKFTEKLPQLDILLLEWRFKIPGRNIDINNETFNSPNLSPDLLMQNELLNYYSLTDTKLVIFDLDYKITVDDELKIKEAFGNKCTIFETSSTAKENTKIIPRISVEIPFWIRQGNEYKIPLNTTPPSEYKHLTYIGSRYERDYIIEKYIIPYSKKFPYKVWFYGNWRNNEDKFSELLNTLKWTDIQYHKRVGHSNFRNIYQDSIACPLLAKSEYYKNGFMTARIQEALYFGTIPIGFSEHKNISKYLPKCLIINSSNSPSEILQELTIMIRYLKYFTKKEYNDLRQLIWDNLNFMDVKHFINTLETC